MNKNTFIQRGFAIRSNAPSVQAYLDELPANRADDFLKFHQTILDHLPQDFEEQISYGMLGYVVPHSTYPNGYHYNPKQPLPFINLGLQKNFIGFYHMGIYADPNLLTWFIREHPKYCKLKLDMGKSYIRFKKTEVIPHPLITELVGLHYMKIVTEEHYE